MPIPLSRTELRQRSALWLLEIDYPGGILRISDKNATVSSDDGDLVFQEGLQGFDLSILSDSEQIGVSFLVESIDFVQGLSRGYTLERMGAELSRWYEGTTFERRRIVATGVLKDVKFGAPGKMKNVTATLVQSASDLGQNICRIVVEPNVFNEAVSVPGFVTVAVDSPSIGLYPPVVIGYPGLPLGAPAVPLLELSLTEDTVGDSKYPRWVIAAHAIDATKVRIYTDRDNDECNDATAGEFITQEDLTVGVVTTATYSTIPFADLQVNTGGKFFTGFLENEGGMFNPYRDGVLRGLSDVVRYMLSEIGRKKVDHSRFESYADDLNGAFKIDTFINDATSGDDWLENHITNGLFPIRIIEGPKGVYARRRNYRPEPSEAVTVLATSGNAGPINVSRQTGLQPVGNEIINRVQVKYQPHMAGTTFSKSVEISPGYYDFYADSPYANLFNQMTHICEVSANLFGERVGVYELRDVWDPTTATMVAVELLFRDAMPRYTILYQGGRDLEFLEIGDVVLINDDELLLSERVATVEDVVFGKSFTQVLVEIRSDGLAFDMATS